MTTTQPEAVWPARGEATPREAVWQRVRGRLPLAGLLGLAAVLYLWGLSRNGYGNEFYSAAVQAGTKSWKAFLFGSLDASNSITVDKPPASLWPMELSARLFGFSSFSLLLPQALEGVAAVWLLHATVRRWFSQPVALLSGLVLALTPVAALMFRFDNPDALLVLLMVLGAYGVTRALERGSTWWLALAGASVGLGFLTKMMQAFLVLPAFALAYLLGAPTPVRRRLVQVLAAGASMVVAGGWWVAVVELVPAADRPYVGGSTGNSILDLIWGYNGLGRLDGGGTGGGPGGGGFSGSPGFLRLFNPIMGGQISWLLPAALIALAAGLVWTLRRPRTDRTRAALVLWGGWLLVTAAVYSFMSGIIHPYYTNTLAPAIAVLAGGGAAVLWDRRRNVAARGVLGAMLVATSLWPYTLLDRSPGWHPWLRYAVLAGGLTTALVLTFAAARLTRVALVSVAAAGLLASVGGPLGYTLSAVARAQTGSTPSAGPTAANGRGGFGFAGGGFGAPTGPRPGGGSSVGTALAALVKSGAAGYTWAAATDSSMVAAPLELATGKAVMAIGGFTGSDRSITLARFEQLVAEGKIHYYVGGGFGGGGFRGGRGGVSSEIASWVASHFTSITAGGTTVYDLTQKA